MRRLALAVVMLVALTTPIQAQDALPAFSEGLAAYESGDYAAAVRVWRIHAARGEAKAQYNLGVMYDNGKGVPEDNAEAVKWWRLSAKQGDADAQYNLGVMYDNGKGVPEDNAEAVKWWRLAAEQGNAKARNNLGYMYDEGKGVPQDYVRAHMWFNLAAAQGKEEMYRNNRNIVAERMTPAQIAEARKMAREWMKKHGQ